MWHICLFMLYWSLQIPWFSSSKGVVAFQVCANMRSNLRCIRLTSQERHRLLNHRQFDYLFYSLLRPTTKKTSDSALLALCEGNSPFSDRFPSEKASDTESLSVSWRYHVRSDFGPLLACFMMTSSNGNIFRVTGPLCGEFTGPGELPAQRPVTRSFDVFFDLHPNKRLSKQWRGWWFETQPCPLWRHRNVAATFRYTNHDGNFDDWIALTSKILRISGMQFCVPRH